MIDDYKGDPAIEYQNFTKAEQVGDYIGSAILNGTLVMLGGAIIYFFVSNVLGGFTIGIAEAYTQLMSLFN